MITILVYIHIIDIFIKGRKKKKLNKHMKEQVLYL